jgi:hypothetical protein
MKTQILNKNCPQCNAQSLSARFNIMQPWIMSAICYVLRRDLALNIMGSTPPNTGVNSLDPRVY